MKNKLHIYGQEFWHTEAYIVGDYDALKSLRDTIDGALLNQNGEASVVLMTNDGESFKAIVLKRELNNVALPYTDEIAAEKRKDVKWPYQLCFDYKKLMEIK